MTRELASPATTIRGAPPHAESVAARVAAMFDEHFESIWRFLRRMGVPEGDVDDAAQEVMLVAMRKVEQIEPGRERGFLFGVAYRVASDTRRARANRRETDGEGVEERVDLTPDPEILVDRLRARAVLDQVLEGMPLDYRAVFVLTEIDGLSMGEIAELLDIPGGTVASRLRRGREHFDARVKRIRAQLHNAEGAR